MREWKFFFNVQILLQLLINLRPLNSALLNTVLGYPSECIHENSIHLCQLSFQCWLQGGRHANGCGGNKWLFSCCVKDSDKFQTSATTTNIIKQKRNKKIALLPKRIMMKRRDEDNNIFKQSECGIPNTFQNTLQKRIIGGRPARFAEYPWQVHIRISEYQCGGVLVSTRPAFIATAAHCIQQADLDDIVVYLGELDTQNSGFITEPIPSEKHRVTHKFVHPKFKFRITQPDRYDIALLKLAKSTGYSSHILPICLPIKPIEIIGKKGLIAGWGKTAAQMGHTGTNILQAATVPIISTSDCLRWHRKKSIRVELFNEMFCAGHSDGHQDACLDTPTN
ncbi:serine proteinase stubble isoform X2 [Condylostylus longicornis]|uniref:serine proteinase stubble isoform X2 n=1 Tax=Condylostylus longicornis TaxID=2530218 RepID=UPI00244E4B44|nr:serine proteinase stubble isoform X2 [Condylostylus longicornis]